MSNTVLLVSSAPAINRTVTKLVKLINFIVISLETLNQHCQCCLQYSTYSTFSTFDIRLYTSSFTSHFLSWNAFTFNMRPSDQSNETRTSSPSSAALCALQHPIHSLSRPTNPASRNKNRGAWLWSLGKASLPNKHTILEVSQVGFT